MLLSPLVLPYPDAVVHPWSEPPPASWTGHFDQAQPLRYTHVQPTVVADIEVDTAYENWRWRHGRLVPAAALSTSTRTAASP